MTNELCLIVCSAFLVSHSSLVTQSLDTPFPGFLKIERHRMTSTAATESITSLQPQRVWEFFAGLSATPRPSKHEERIQAHALSLAEDLDFAHRQDDAGNIVMEAPATPGYEDAPTVVLQGHLDMVAEKNSGVEHDFLNDPIQLVIDTDAETGGRIVRAQGTTLGADNGIGVALALAAATDPDVTHGPLEILLTSDEEMGMTGANALKPGFISGKMLINLDSEEDDALYIGCAGGADVTLAWNLATSPGEARFTPLRVSVAGLRGGHSGCDIHLNRGNAIKLLAQVLAAAPRDGVRLVSIVGGSKRNAIPREANAEVLATDAARTALEEAAREVQQRAQRANGEANCEIAVGAGSASNAAAATAKATGAFVEALVAAPSGVLAIVPDIPGLVQTSNNISTLVSEVENGSLRIVAGCLTRSSSVDDINWATQQVCAAGELGGAASDVGNQYPGWQPDANSKLLAICRDVYADVFGSDPKVLAIHAGLECGIIGERVGGGVQMISFGPNIRGAHSPDERVFVDSVERMYGYLAAVLRRLADA